MKSTEVYVPVMSRITETECVEWCWNNVSPYSTETTWTRRPVPKHKFGSIIKFIFVFYNASDAVAFKLRFGL